VVNELNLILPTLSDAFKVQEFVLDDEGNAKKNFTLFYFLPVASTSLPFKRKAEGVDKTKQAHLYDIHATLIGNYRTLKCRVVCKSGFDNK
jgi:hypothetical protein